MAVDKLIPIGLTVGELPPAGAGTSRALLEELAARLPRKKERKRRRTLAQVRAEADKAGFSVKAATLQPDGGVRLEFGACDVAAAASDDDEAEQWISQHAHRS